MKNWTQYTKAKAADVSFFTGGYQPKCEPTKIEQHKLDLIKQLESWSFLKKVFNLFKWMDKLDELKNHQKHFPELYL